MHRPPCGIDHRGIAIDQARDFRSPAGPLSRGRLQGLHLPGDFVRPPDVVLIGRQDVCGPVAPSLLQKPGEIFHHASPRTIVGRDDDPPIVPGRIAENLPRRIAAAVVSDQQGPVGMRLLLNAPQQFWQPGFALVGGQQDVDGGRGHIPHYNGFRDSTNWELQNHAASG